MPTSQNLSTLVINKVESEDVYNYMKDNNLLNDNELYLTPDNSSALLKPFKVTITGTESDGTTTYSSDKTYTQIKTAFDDGNYYVYAVLEGWSGLYRLTQCSDAAVFDASDPYWFSNIKVSTDNSVEVNDSAIDSKVFYVTLTKNDDETYTVDKTADEIFAAYNAGRVIMFKDTNSVFLATPSIINEDDTYIVFTVTGTNINYIYRYDGTWSCEITSFVKESGWTDSDKGKYLQIDDNGEVAAASPASNDFTVTATLASLTLTTATVDKTLTEIEAAYQAGKNIICNLVISGSNGATVKLVSVERLTLSGAFVFSGLAASYMSGSETYAAVFLKITSDGNTFTTKTLT